MSLGEILFNGIQNSTPVTTSVKITENKEKDDEIIEYGESLDWKELAEDQFINKTEDEVKNEKEIENSRVKNKKEGIDYTDGRIQALMQSVASTNGINAKSEELEALQSIINEYHAEAKDLTNSFAKNTSVLEGSKEFISKSEEIKALINEYAQSKEDENKDFMLSIRTVQDKYDIKHRINTSETNTNDSNISKNKDSFLGLA